MKSTRRGTLSRRRFLGASAGTAAALGLAPPSWAVPRVQARADDPPAGDLPPLRAAVVGTGRRGQDHLVAMGYLDKASELATRKKLRYDRVPGVSCVAVCDPYDANRAEGARQVRGMGFECAEYLDYREMFAKEELDGVIIATPDHLHAPIAIAAAEAGIDVYVEKCIANDLEQTFAMGEAVERHGRVFQSGYQHAQDHIHELARGVVRDGHIGDVKLVEYFFHRGGEPGAWVFPEEKDGGPPRDQIHWDLFLGDAPAVEYSPKRYFGWRCFWDYSTGICGDILSHALGAIDRVVGLGVPSSVNASGGVYFWKDGRETPDQLAVTCEYEEDEVTIVFQSCLHNAFPKQTCRILGTEGTMELDYRLRVYPDRFSKKYEKRLEAGTLDWKRPFINVEDAAAALAVQAEPSQLWLSGRGATLTTQESGRVVDTTRLHHEDFWSSVRTREQPSASFADALPSTIASHMATVSYREGRRVRWDAETRRIV